MIFLNYLRKKAIISNPPWLISREYSRSDLSDFRFDLLEEKTGKQGTCVLGHNGQKGKWGAVYPFFGQSAGFLRDLKNKEYGVYRKE